MKLIKREQAQVFTQMGQFFLDDRVVINSSAHFNMTSARIVVFDVTNRTKFENAQLIIMKNAAELA